MNKNHHGNKLKMSKFMLKIKERIKSVFNVFGIGANDLRAKIRNEPHSLYRRSRIYQNRVFTILEVTSCEAMNSNSHTHAETEESHIYDSTCMHAHNQLTHTHSSDNDDDERCNRLSDVCAFHEFYILNGFETQSCSLSLNVRL